LILAALPSQHLGFSRFLFPIGNHPPLKLTTRAPRTYLSPLFSKQTLGPFDSLILWHFSLPDSMSLSSHLDSAQCPSKNSSSLSSNHFPPMILCTRIRNARFLTFFRTPSFGSLALCGVFPSQRSGNPHLFRPGLRKVVRRILFRRSCCAIPDSHLPTRVCHFPLEMSTTKYFTRSQWFFLQLRTGSVFLCPQHPPRVLRIQYVIFVSHDTKFIPDDRASPLFHTFPFHDMKNRFRTP